MDENLVEILQEKYIVSLLIMISVYGLKKLFMNKTEVEPYQTVKNGLMTQSFDKYDLCTKHKTMT